MDFNLTEEQKMLQKTVANFARERIAPRIKELDQKGQFDKSVFKEMAQLGLLGICVPQKYGGADFDYISLGLACWELEKVDTSLRVILSVHVALNSLAILQWGSDEQKRKYLMAQAKGERIATFGLTEPNAGSDVAGIQSHARRDGGCYVLNGEKTWISLADVADNFLVFAYTDRDKERRGISAFIVERGFKGVSTSTIHGKLGIRAGNTGSISLQDVRVPKENLLGEEGEGFKIAMSALDNGRYTVAAGSLGIIEASLLASVDYAKKREAFGKAISEFELVKEKVAKMESSLAIGRLLVYYVGWLKNLGMRNTRETSVAKWTNTKAAFEAASDALQIHGAYGYSDEYPVERYFRNARGALIYEGASEIQQLILSEYALGERFDKPLRCELPKYEETS